MRLAARLRMCCSHHGVCSGHGCAGRPGGGAWAAGKVPVPHRKPDIREQPQPPLAPIQLSPQRLQEIGVTTAAVTYKDVNDDLNVPGNVDIDEQRLSYVQTRFPGWIQDVYANATYQYVRKGQRLFTIYSPDLVSSEQEYLLARQNQKAFSTRHAHGMAAQEGGWLLQAAEERLAAIRRSRSRPSRIWNRAARYSATWPIESPASGYIIERNALPNAYVQPETKLYTIADLSTVWVYANVFQN